MGKGDRNPKVGTNVEFTPSMSEKGKCALMVTAVGFGDYCEGGRSKGTICSFTKHKGGVITPDDGSADISFDIKDVWEPSLTFKCGQKVEYDPLVQFMRPMAQQLIAIYVTAMNGKITRFVGGHLERKLRSKALPGLDRRSALLH